MNKAKLFLKTVFTFLVLASIKSTYAQQERVDSIIAVLQKMKASKSIDTAMFDAVRMIIEKIKLNDASVAALEKAAGDLSEANDLYWHYGIRMSIMNSLITTDEVKAISYGKHNMELLQKSKAPLAVNIRSAFFQQLRIPFRTSSMLDEGFAYFSEKLKEYKLKNDSVGLSDCYYVLGGFYRTKGLMEAAIYNMKKAGSYINSSAGDKSNTSEFINPLGKNSTRNTISVVGIYYMLNGDYNQALKYLNEAFEELKKSNSTSSNIPANLAMAKLLYGRSDSVKYLLDYALWLEGNQKNKDFLTYALQAKAFYNIQTNQLAKAEASLQECWQLIRQNNIPANAPAGTISPDYYLALIRIKQNRLPEAIAALQKDIEWIHVLRLDKLRDYKLLVALQEQQGAFRQASISYKSFFLLQDSLLQDQKKYSSLSFETEKQMNDKELSITRLQSENAIASLTRNFIIGIAALLLVLAALIYYRYKSKQKDNIVLEQTLANLKTTQAQLVQSEKMASLGELTAGIAHEIQNPLNFVNNFSEVSSELVEELIGERAKVNGERDEELEIEILNDLSQNLEKINHHGKRADAIVKGMLQHSRTNTGKKEPTDINALADEYLRLAYHGLRAKDKDFNADFKTEFAQNIGMLEVVPQDIGRVFLNLFNNAFYAVNEKKKQLNETFQPTVTVTTKRTADKVEILVKDNGNGIPQKVVDKIFQPFFTTKPTGQGTGLGLSLSYDIIKAHGGDLRVETKEGEGAEFTIQLPVLT